ncbi:MAG: B12-binding domain-containing radical SAM protein [Candidatus Omnitrophica bacterium]|nr:B12-binding domain-containing radical SAM protein [Candidatus Omnitrophota bacterium]
MNVLLVNTKIKNASLGVMYISSTLKKNNHFTIACDASYTDIRKTLGQHKVKVVGFSCFSTHYNKILGLAHEIKQEFPHILILFGGPHPTVVPEIIQESSIDGVCIGEGEYAFVELIDKLDTGGSINQVKNWWIKENGRIYKNPIRDLIHELDKLPFPDRKLYYRKPACQSIIISRGCLYSCSYCIQPFLNKLYRGKGENYRMRSLENVMEELEMIKLEINTEIIIFHDDVFPIRDIQWLEKFSSAYKKKIDIPFFVKLRPNEVKQGNIKLLKQAGCHIIGMGIESGDEYVRNKIMKRNMENECILKAAEVINNHRIKWVAYNIIGIPGVDIEKDIKTLKLNKKCKPSLVAVSFFQPFPGTALETRAREFNLFVDYNDRSGSKNEDSFNYNILRYPGNQKRLLQNFQYLFLLSLKLKIPTGLVQLLIKFPCGRFYSLLWIVSRLICFAKFIVPIKLKKYFKKII